MGRIRPNAGAAEIRYLEGTDVILMDYDGTNFHRQSEMQINRLSIDALQPACCESHVIGGNHGQDTRRQGDR
jgi:hypothetical protein